MKNSSSSNKKRNSKIPINFDSSSEANDKFYYNLMNLPKELNSLPTTNINSPCNTNNKDCINYFYYKKQNKKPNKQIQISSLNITNQLNDLSKYSFENYSSINNKKKNNFICNNNITNAANMQNITNLNDRKPIQKSIVNNYILHTESNNKKYNLNTKKINDNSRNIFNKNINSNITKKKLNSSNENSIYRKNSTSSNRINTSCNKISKINTQQNMNKNKINTSLRMNNLGLNYSSANYSICNTNKNSGSVTVTSRRCNSSQKKSKTEKQSTNKKIENLLNCNKNKNKRLFEFKKFNTKQIIAKITEKYNQLVNNNINNLIISNSKSNSNSRNKNNSQINNRNSSSLKKNNKISALNCNSNTQNKFQKFSFPSSTIKNSNKCVNSYRPSDCNINKIGTNNDHIIKKKSNSTKHTNNIRTFSTSKISNVSNNSINTNNTNRANSTNLSKRTIKISFKPRAECYNNKRSETCNSNNEIERSNGLISKLKKQIIPLSQSNNQINNETNRLITINSNSGGGIGTVGNCGSNCKGKKNYCRNEKSKFNGIAYFTNNEYMFNKCSNYSYYINANNSILKGDGSKKKNHSGKFRGGCKKYNSELKYSENGS